MAVLFGQQETCPHTLTVLGVSYSLQIQSSKILLIAHHGWVTSPVIDLRPNANGRATPVQFDLTGTDTQEEN